MAFRPINLTYSIFKTLKSVTFKPLHIKRYLRGMPICSDLPRIKAPDTQQNLVVDHQSTIHNETLIPKSATTLQDSLSNDYNMEYLDTIAPPLPKSFNLAAYVNKSKTLQKLIEMGVDLYSIELRGHGQYYAELDFDRDIRDVILFLNSINVNPNDLGLIITRNPKIFDNTLDEMKIRVEYLRRKKFTLADIVNIVTRTPKWLSVPIKIIDKQLGFLQTEFKLKGDEVRLIVNAQPKLVFVQIMDIKAISFVLNEEMGFEKEELKQLILSKPKVWRLSRREITERLNYIHNEIGISHEDILQFPGCLLRRKFLFEERHIYLIKLGKAQYDKTKPGYVSLKALITATDVDFCQDIAKTSVQDFNKFLKTL